MTTEILNDTLLIEVCQEIGGISECNSHYTDVMAAKVKETGKDLLSFTLAEFLEIHRKHSREFNEMMQGIPLS